MMSAEIIRLDDRRQGQRDADEFSALQVESAAFLAAARTICWSNVNTDGLFQLEEFDDDCC